MTSWDQYRQVLDVIVRLNGWDDATVALQLLSHLEGDALNVALLEINRATLARLVGALTEYYGSPGRLADYRHQYERTTRQEGEDPSIFAIALETRLKHLAIWALTRNFGSYWTGLLLVMRTVPCHGISIVFHWRLPSGTLLTGVECGRVTRTRVSVEL